MVGDQESIPLYTIMARVQFLIVANYHTVEKLAKVSC